LEDEKKRLPQRVVTLRDTWLDGCYKEGYSVHVVGQFDSQGHCIVDDTKNWLVLHPDHLISATVVADSFGCTRRAVLQDRVKATSGTNEAVVYGSILHEVFQECLRVNCWDTQSLKKTMETVAIRYLENLYEINTDIPLAVNNLMMKAQGLQNWAYRWVAARPNPEATIEARRGDSVTMCINKLLDVEEHVWAPKYGLKGNIDATVQVIMQENGEEKTLTVPFEVKTGKNTTSISHRAQTTLYTLLLSDRYGKLPAA
jgi:DNA replication ATP-dependent helicase Dna2